jgi:hypothetical protein
MPTLLVIRDVRRMPLRKSLLRDRLLKQVVIEAKTQRARVQIVKTRPIDVAEKLTKYERAQAVVKLFPVLTKRLPPKRKPWESERYTMSMFEALAIAAQYPEQVL